MEPQNQRDVEGACFLSWAWLDVASPLAPAMLDSLIRYVADSVSMFPPRFYLGPVWLLIDSADVFSILSHGDFIRFCQILSDFVRFCAILSDSVRFRVHFTLDVASWSVQAKGVARHSRTESDRIG